MIASTTPMHPLLLIVLKAAKLDRPDGRRLYRYAMSERQFQLLRKDLHLRSTRCGWNALDSDAAAAMFVLGAAEFIRCAQDSHGWRWEPICKQFGLRYSVPSHKFLSDAVRRGLFWWRRGLFEAEHATAYLKSLAFESGIPVAAVGPWLQRWVVETTRSVRLGKTAQEAAKQYEFIAPIGGGELLAPAVGELAADIARILVGVPPVETRLGVEAVTWLDARRPGWRQELGIRLPEGAVNQLLRAVVAELPRESGRVLATRLLTRGTEGWVAAIRVDLAGGVPAAWQIGQMLIGRNRARLLPAGALLESIQTPLAILLLQSDSTGEETWRLQPVGRAVFPLAPHGFGHGGGR